MPVFNGFDMSDGEIITERIVFKGFGQRAVTRANVARREGIKILDEEFGEKTIEISGRLVLSSASALQSKLDIMKTALAEPQASLVIESARTFTATVERLEVPDEHYNQSMAPFSVVFVCDDPFAIGSLALVGVTTPSGIATISGSLTISGTLFGRPVFTYIPPSGTVAGSTNISELNLMHIETGQQVTVSGFGTGGNVDYQSQIIFDFDLLKVTEDGDSINFTGSFAKWDVGSNAFLFKTKAGQVFPGGLLMISYTPRWT